MNRLRYFLYFRGIVLTTDRMLTLDKIYQASYALKTVIRRTDLISAPNINPESHIFLKPENLQVTGSFKVRGACFKIAQLTEEEKSHGVVAWKPCPRCGISGYRSWYQVLNLLAR